MNHVLKIDEFKCFNGFYRKPECRTAVLKLYKGICQFCDDPIEGNTFHVAHIIARTYPELMEKYFPGLDVDNLLNLQLSCPPCNLGASNFVLDSPFLLMKAFTLSARAISQRWRSIEEQLRSKETFVRMSGIDPKICSDVLHLDMDALQEMSFDWRGALVISDNKLRDCIRQEMREVFGREPGSMEVCAATKEAVEYFKDRVRVDGSSIEAVSRTKPAWWTEAWEQHSRHIEHRHRAKLDEGGAVDTTAVPDGIYLNPEEVNARQGMWIPLRNETQRWFYDIFRTLIQLRRLLESRTEGGRYMVLDEWEWRALCDCDQLLGYVQSGLGIPFARHLNGPDIIAHFTVSYGELYIHDPESDIPEQIKQLCRLTGSTTDWSAGTVLRRTRLKSWLERAFNLADTGVQKATSGYLVRIGNEQTGWFWVPPLPYTKGKTREEVSLEIEQRTKKGRRKAKTPALVLPKLVV